MRSRFLLVSNLILGLALLAWVLYRYGGPAFGVLSANPNPIGVLVFVVSVFATIATLSWRWGYVLGPPARSLGLLRLSLYRSAAHTLAVLIPSGKLGGDPLRAWLATRRGVPAGPSIASVAVDRTLEMGASAPFSVLFAVLLLREGVPQLGHALVTIVMGALALGVGAALAVRRLRAGRGLVTSLLRRIRLDRLASMSKGINVAAAAEEAIVGLVADSRRMVWAFVLGLVANVLVVLEFVLLFHAFGLPLTTTTVVAAIFATGAAHTLPIPGGLGVLEGAQVWIFQFLGYSTDVGLAVGLAVRLRELLWMAPGVAYWLVSSLRTARDSDSIR